MSFYRNTYLRSDDWKDLRLAKIFESRGKCYICGQRSMSNDVHHLKYKRLYDVELGDLIVLCRKHHDETHALLSNYPKLRTLPIPLLKRTVIKHLRKSHRLKNAQRACASRESKRDQWFKCRVEHEFGKARQSLRGLGIISKHLMPLLPELIKDIEFHKTFDTPMIMLSEYMRKTGMDPRCATAKSSQEWLR